MVEYPPRQTRALVFSYGANIALGIHGQRKKAIWKRTGRLSYLPVTRSIIGYGNANVICATEPDDTLTNIRLGSIDIVEITEGDDDVVTEMEGVPNGAFRWS